MNLFNKQSNEERFWKWFAANADGIANIRSGDNPLIGKIQTEIQRIHKDLVFEVGRGIGGVKEFVVSADGIKSMIPAVEELVAAAPPIRDWRIVAFRPRVEGVALEFNGRRLGPDSIFFVAQPSDGKLNLWLFVDGLNNENRRQLMHACFLLLDTTIGEFDVMTRIGSIEFAPLIEADGKQRPLVDLAEVVDAVKAS